MHYIIQDGLLSDTHHIKLIEYLDRRGLTYEKVRYMPFIAEIEFTTTRKDVWCFGSVNMAIAGEKYGWKPGMMFNDNHDFEVYGPKYGDNMLNADSVIINFTDPLPETGEFFFARPTRDTKIFTGEVFSRESWEEYKRVAYDQDATQYITSESKIQISSPKNIQQEIRCFVVDGKVITSSLYRLGGRTVKKNYDDEEAAMEFAQRMVDLYQPAKAFVIDICLVEDEYKIVEINLINGCGFYEINMGKLVEALEETFG